MLEQRQSLARKLAHMLETDYRSRLEFAIKLDATVIDTVTGIALLEHKSYTPSVINFCLPKMGSGANLPTPHLHTTRHFMAFESTKCALFNLVLDVRRRQCLQSEEAIELKPERLAAQRLM